MGTPCNPFSVQRDKRFKGTVTEHHLAEYTFSDARDMLAKFEPVHAIFEQTEGFAKPLVKGGQKTPQEMLLVLVMALKGLWFKHVTWDMASLQRDRLRA